MARPSDFDALPSSAELAIERAVTLRATHGITESIRFLQAANRTFSSELIERELIRLRVSAFARSDRKLNGVAPSPAERSLRIEPETDLALAEPRDLTAALVRDAIATRGSLLVRGLLTEAEATRLRDAVDAAFAARVAADADRSEHSRWFSPVANVGGTRTFLGTEALLTGDSPRALFDLLDVFEARGVGQLVREYMMEPPALSFEKCVLRRLEPTGGGSWHQDGAFLGRDIQALNIWIALSPCGREAPGLEVVPRRVRELLPTGCYFQWDVADQVVREAVPGVEMSRPEFRPGDALLFDQLCVHRTFRTPTMTQPRYAVESWFFSPSAYPAKGHGLVL
jgi:hypothetical protein